MESRARILGHSAHQIVVVFPLGLLTTSAVLDGLRIVTGNSLWSVMAFHLLTGGIGMGWVAAIFGFADYRAIPVDTRARAVARIHGVTSALLLLVFSLSWALRVAHPETQSLAAIAVSAAGVAVAGVAGWLGGELVGRMAIGVADDAGLDAVGTFAAWRMRARGRTAAERIATATVGGAPREAPERTST